jgi:hypothetical protein
MTQVHSAEPCQGGEARYELLVHHVVEPPDLAAESLNVTAALAHLALPNDSARIGPVVEAEQIDPMAVWSLAESENENSARMKHIIPAMTTVVRHCIRPGGPWGNVCGGSRPSRMGTFGHTAGQAVTAACSNA